jgi:hypothetical protein
VSLVDFDVAQRTCQVVDQPPRHAGMGACSGRRPGNNSVALNAANVGVVSSL